MSSEIEEAAEKWCRGMNGYEVAKQAFYDGATTVLEKAQALAVEDGWVKLDDLEALFEEKEREGK